MQSATNSSQPPRLLYVVNVAWFFISHRLPLALAAQKAGYEVHVAAAVEEAGEAQAIRDAGLFFHRIRAVRGSRNPLDDIVTLFDLGRLVTRIRPRLVHAVTAKPIIHAGIVCRVFGVPAFVGAMTGLGHLFIDPSRRMLRTVAAKLMGLGFSRSSSRLIVQNRHDLEVLVECGVVSRERAVLIPGSGVDLTRFSATPEREGPPVVVFPARMIREKGIVEFCRAAAILKSAGIAARFVLVGGIDTCNPSGLTTAEVEYLVGEAGVEWWGHRGDMATVFAAAHIVCLPSYGEGLPKALIEAAAAARAIVTTDVPGCRDVVSNGVNGLLVPPRDSVALAAALRGLLADANLRGKLGAAARARACSEFDVREVISRTLAVYRQLNLSGN